MANGNGKVENGSGTVFELFLPDDFSTLNGGQETTV
jgi:hypothetical protein